MRQSAARYNRRLTVLRRAVLDDGTGVQRGAFAPVAGLTRVSARYRELGLRDQALAASIEGVIEAEVFLRDCAAARTISAEDRFEIEGQGFAIQAAGLPNRETGEIRFAIKRSVG